MSGGDSILEALDLEARYQTLFWDALVIQAAHEGGADILYSEDCPTANGTERCSGKNARTRGE